MTFEDLKYYMLKDNYIDISFRNYIAFKETYLYEKSYKKEILSRLNQHFKGLKINKFNVLNFVKQIQKENHLTGCFVHRSYIADFVKYTEACPEEVSELLNQLFSSSQSIEERIDLFREKEKESNLTISLGAPLFGYLLAAIDCTKYPIFKQEVFIDVKKNYGIEIRSGTAGYNYQTYLEMCQIALEHFQPMYPELTILDIQDFFSCSTQYNQIRSESAVEYLHGVVVKLDGFMKHLTNC